MFIVKHLLQILVVSILSLVIWNCDANKSPKPEAISLLGQELYAGEADDSLIVAIDKELAQDPDNTEILFRKGRALAGMRRFNDAIVVYKKCIELDPENPVFCRRLGHRYISIRKFDDAVAALEKAAELNKRDISEEKLWKESWGTWNWRHEFDIQYHLGLAYYLKRDFTNAAAAYHACREAALDDNSRVAASYWLYLALRRLGREPEADALLSTITSDMDVTSNYTYLNLLLYFKGDITENELLEPERYGRLETMAYGMGAFYLVNGEPEGANEIFERIMKEDYWSGFGFIAAEAQLAAEK